MNPVATRVTARVRRSVEDALRPWGLATVRVTRAPGDGAQLTRRATQEGADLVVTLGGDGIANEAAGALAGGPVPLVPLPGGSTNVLARVIGWPQRLPEAIGMVGATLAAPTVRSLSLARVSAAGVQRIICVNLGLGIDAHAAALVEGHPRLKRSLRQLAFAGAATRAAVDACRHPPRLTVDIAAREPLQVATFVVACAAPYAYLGRHPMDVVPGPAFDGTLGYMGLDGLTLTRVAGIVAGALTGGWHTELPWVASGGTVAPIVVQAADPVHVQADGEPLGRHERVVIRPGPCLLVPVPATARLTGRAVRSRAAPIGR